MLKRPLWSVAAFVACAMIASPLYADDPVTDFVLGGIERKANDLLDHATANGDFLVQRIAQQALAVIKAWKESNLTLIGTAFDRLDNTTKTLFNDMNTTLSRLEDDKTIAVRDAEKLSSNWSATIKNLPFTNHAPEVFDYYPRVIRPVGSHTIPVHIVGPRLASESPYLTDEKSAAQISVGKATDIELIANLERDKLNFNNDGSNLARYKLTFNAGNWRWWNPSTWWKDDATSRDITVWLLPKAMAEYKLTPTLEESKSESSTFGTTLSPHGKDSGYPVTISVPPNLSSKGWVIDVDKVLKGGFWSNPAQTGGSSCTGPDQNSAVPDHFIFNMQLGHETGDFGHKSDGSVTCVLTVPISRVVKTPEPGQPMTGSLTWTDDKPLDLSPNTLSYVLELKMFDGRSYTLKDKTVEPYGVVEIIRDKDSLIFRPHPPSDF